MSNDLERLRRGETLIVATHNAGKLREIRDLLAPHGIDVVSAGELGLPEPKETEATFEGNARLKALAAAKASGLPALSDDSGLEVDALTGAPGVFTADWAGPRRDFLVGMRRVQARLAEIGAVSPSGRRANFSCTLCLARPNGSSHCWEGKVHGHLIWPPRGMRGFGFDPMFVPNGYDQTFGEMDPALKHRISHRAVAFEAFLRQSLECS
jgi:XTP/dITP diphosphohydrolase